MFQSFSLENPRIHVVFEMMIVDSQAADVEAQILHSDSVFVGKKVLKELTISADRKH